MRCRSPQKIRRRTTELPALRHLRHAVQRDEQTAPTFLESILDAFWRVMSDYAVHLFYANKIRLLLQKVKHGRSKLQSVLRAGLHRRYRWRALEAADRPR